MIRRTRPGNSSQSSRRNFLVIRHFVYIRAPMAMVLNPKPKITVRYSPILKESGTTTWAGMASSIHEWKKSMAVAMHGGRRSKQKWGEKLSEWNSVYYLQTVTAIELAWIETMISGCPPPNRIIRWRWEAGSVQQGKAAYRSTSGRVRYLSCIELRDLPRNGYRCRKRARRWGHWTRFAAQVLPSTPSSATHFSLVWAK